MTAMILVVDDEATAADLLGMVLGMHFPQAKVCVAHDGHAALDLASRQRPDVAILDLEMPGIDGETLALTLRASFPHSAPLLIALSGNVARLAASRGNGAFDHRLSKPAELDVLVPLLTKALPPPAAELP